MKQKIRRILEQHLVKLDNFPTAWEGVKFEPKGKQSFYPSILPIPARFPTSHYQRKRAFYSSPCFLIMGKVPK